MSHLQNKELKNVKTDKKRTAVGWFKIIGSTSVFILCFIFALLAVKYIDDFFVIKNKVIFAVCIESVLFFIFLSALLLNAFNVQLGYKIAFSALVFILIILFSAFILGKTGILAKLSSVEALRAYVSAAGPFGSVLFMILQYLQVVILPIPSFVSTLAGVAMFGPFECLLLSFTGIVLGSLTAFIIGKVLGYRFAAWIVGKETLDKWLEKVKGKDKILLTAMFMLPLFPDDVLCFVAGLSTMGFGYFIIMIIVSRFVAIGFTCYSASGALIPYNTWWGITIWVVLIVLFALGFKYLIKNSEKIENALKKRFGKGVDRLDEEKVEAQKRFSSKNKRS